jgi:hypothetical protein
VLHNTTAGPYPQLTNFGNPIRRDPLTWNSSARIFARELPGVVVLFPNMPSSIQQVRSLRFTLPVNVESLQIWGPTGKMCLTVLTPQPAGTEVNADCVVAFAKEALGVSLKRVLDTFGSSIPFRDYYSNNTWDYVVWYSGEVSTNWSLILSSRNTSYNGLWNSVHDSILVDGVFPYNKPYHDRCVELGGSFSVPTKHELELFHSNFISKRRCTEDYQCKKFSFDGKTARPYACIYDSVYHIPWRNTDHSVAVTSVGDEGGCELGYAAGVFEPSSSGSLCMHGYGPEGKCHLPADPKTTSGEVVCGGHGETFHRNITWTNQTEVWSVATDRAVIKTCSSVLYGGVEYTAVVGGSLLLHSFLSGDNYIHVIDSVPYLDGEVITQVQCKEYTDRPPYRHRILGYVLYFRDEWTSFLL